jgi:hypothetical protein
VLIEQTDFQAWLGRHDASHFDQGAVDTDLPRDEADRRCDCCGGPLGETPSRAAKKCLVCLAELFGGDIMQEQLLDKFIGGIIRETIAGDMPRVLPHVVRQVVDEAIETVDYSGRRATPSAATREGDS